MNYDACTVLRAAVLQNCNDGRRDLELTLKLLRMYASVDFAEHM